MGHFGSEGSRRALKGSNGLKRAQIEQTASEYSSGVDIHKHTHMFARGPYWAILGHIGPYWAILAILRGWLRMAQNGSEWLKTAQNWLKLARDSINTTCVWLNSWYEHTIQAHA